MKEQGISCVEDGTAIGGAPTPILRIQGMVTVPDLEDEATFQEVSAQPQVPHTAPASNERFPRWYYLEKVVQKQTKIAYWDFDAGCRHSSPRQCCMGCRPCTTL